MFNKEKKISAFKNKAHRILLELNYRQMKTNAYVKETITILVGKYELLLTTIKRSKLSYYGHLCRHDSLSKTSMQGRVEDTRVRGRPKKDWMVNIIQWTDKTVGELVKKVKDRNGWRRFVVVVLDMIPPTMHELRD